MARTFTAASSHEVVCSTGALSALTGASVTIVAVMRRGVNSAWHSIWSMNDSGDNYSGWGLLLTDAGKPYIQNDGAGPSSMTITTSDEWVVVAVNKGSGTATPRFHKYVFTSDTWTHENGAATQADGSAGGASGKAKFGTYNGGADRLTGDIAAVGVWNSVLTDAQIETLAHSLHAWHALAPSAMWVLDQSFLTSGGTSAPTASGAVTSNSAGNTTSYAAPIPDNLAAGDRVIIGVVKDGTGTITWPGSPAWSTMTNGAQTSDSHHMEIRYRDIDGTEGWSGTGNTITVTGASEGYASYAVKAAAGTYDTATAPESDGAFTSANSTTPDPPSVTPSWGALSTLWIVLYGWDGNVAHSAYPTNYSSNQATDRWANTGGSGIAGATREATVSPENPGTASIASGEEWAAFTVGIKPISTTHVVNDLTGGGADQTAITGTAVSTNSAPIGYGHDVVAPHSVPAGGGDATVTPTVVAATASIPAVTVLAGAVAAPAVVAATATIGTATVAAGSVITPAAVAATATIPAPTIAAGSTVTPATVAAVASVPTPAVSAGGSATVTPAVVSATATVPTVTVSGGALATPSTVAATSTVGAVTVAAGSTVTATQVAAVASVPTPAVSAGGSSTVSSATVSAAATVPAVTVSTSVTITATAVAATATVPTVTVRLGALIQPSTVAVTATVPAVTTMAGATATPTTVAAVATVPAVDVVIGVRVTPAERIYIVPAENRIYVVPAENRIYVVPAENRILVVT